MDKKLSEFKKDVISVCRHKLREAHEKTLQQVNGLRESLESESKSTAGDKHETGRAMVQLEMERAATRLQSQEENLKLFERMLYNEVSPSGPVTPGCLLQTSLGYYFVAVSLGVLPVNNVPVMVVSPGSPVGQVLLGKKKGDMLTFNGKQLELTAMA